MNLIILSAEEYEARWKRWQYVKFDIALKIGDLDELMKEARSLELSLKSTDRWCQEVKDESGLVVQNEIKRILIKD